MTGLRLVKTNFTAGEISPQLLGRGDLRGRNDRRRAHGAREPLAQARAGEQLHHVAGVRGAEHLERLGERELPDGQTPDVRELVAQALTPKFWNFFSDSSPSHLAEAPVAITSVSAIYTSPESPVATNGRFDRSTEIIVSCIICVPTCAACFSICSISQGP